MIDSVKVSTRTSVAPLNRPPQVFWLIWRQCSVFSAQCSVFSVQCSVFRVQCSVFSVQCSVFSVQCSVFSVQCSVFSLWFLDGSCEASEHLCYFLEFCDEGRRLFGR